MTFILFSNINYLDAKCGVESPTPCSLNRKESYCENTPLFLLILLFFFFICIIIEAKDTHTLFQRVLMNSLKALILLRNSPGRLTSSMLVRVISAPRSRPSWVLPSPHSSGCTRSPGRLERGRELSGDLGALCSPCPSNALTDTECCPWGAHCLVSLWCLFSVPPLLW